MTLARKLTTGDMTKIAKLLSGTMGEYDFEGQEASVIGMTVFTQLMEKADGEVTEILADICGMSVEDFNSTEPDFIFDVVDEISKQPGITRFLEKLQKMIGG